MALETSISKPLYEAMYLSSAALQWLEQQEHAENHKSYYELSANLGQLTSAIGEFVEQGSRGNFVADQNLAGLGYLIDVLNQMTQLLLEKTRASILPTVPDPLKNVIALQLDTVATLSDRTEDILECWKLSLDSEQVQELRSRIESIDRAKKEIPDWREALELISD